MMVASRRRRAIFAGAGFVGCMALLSMGCSQLPAQSPGQPPPEPAPASDPCEKVGTGSPGNDQAVSGSNTGDGVVSAGQQKQLRCYERNFKQADAELNRVYGQLRRKLPEPVRTDIQDNSRGWIQAKEYYCGFQAEINPRATAVERKISLLACTYAFTVDRTAYLRQAFGREGVNGRVWTGRYGDGYSGDLELKALGARQPDARGKVGQKYSFEITVVRGPTAHVGEIDGQVEVFAQADGSLYGVFAERPECPAIKPSGSELAPGPAGNAEPCCRIEFRLTKVKGFRRIAVKEHSCGYYHGARAYFDGDYRKTQ